MSVKKEQTDWWALGAAFAVVATMIAFEPPFGAFSSDNKKPPEKPAPTATAHTPSTPTPPTLK